MELLEGDFVAEFHLERAELADAAFAGGIADAFEEVAVDEA